VQRFQMGREGLAGPDHRPIGQNDRTQLESSTAMWAHDRLPGLKIVSLELGKIKAIAQLDQSADGIEPHLAVGVHEAEIADPSTTLRAGSS
jgi:hypothetical protein